MTVSLRSGDKIRIVDVTGDVDMKNSPTLRQNLFDALKDNPAVALNLTEVRYIDSSGIAVMIEAVRESKRLNKRFVLFGISPAVYNVFKLTHVTGIFEVVETEQQALGA